MSAPHAWRDLVALHALDALDDVERAGLETHLVECAECRAELGSMRETAGLLAHAAPLAAPPARLRERIVADARGSAAPAVRGAPTAAAREPAPPAGVLPLRPRARAEARPARWAPWLAAAAALALAVLGAFGYLQERDARVAAEAGLRDADAAVAARDSLLAAVLGAEVRTTRLTSTGEPPSLQLFWNEERGVMVVAAHRLPSAAPGRTYQLWGLTPEGAAVGLGTFDTGADGRATLAVTVPAGTVLTASAVTEEPEGGSPQPTTTPFLIGSWGE